MRLHLQLMWAAVRAGKPAESQDFWENEDLELRFPEGRLQSKATLERVRLPGRHFIRRKNTSKAPFPLWSSVLNLALPWSSWAVLHQGHQGPGSTEAVCPKLFSINIWCGDSWFSSCISLPGLWPLRKIFIWSQKSWGLSVPLLMVKMRNEP